MANYKNARPARPLPYDDKMQPKPLWNAIAQSFQGVGRSATSTSGQAR
jgi:endo-1,4-beta-xylanase